MRITAVIVGLAVVVGAVGYFVGGQWIAPIQNRAVSICAELGGYDSGGSVSWRVGVPAGWVCHHPGGQTFLGWTAPFEESYYHTPTR
ncbi:hypothetical protein FHX42_002119 [Saccharopolyspora lacisalsi]|uniref:Uncharacterized protein n=1 Tax=Halosaccharopolyspora lacisalsi TaxID=1000566 RepID=A0A839DS00_9PSEU|nr:hypothetical protein [Halosaccharopolyspora lacisalsi]MBA8824772.1 hypothetical protein [Halosaccharopolyspora lacisalsi]